MVAAINTASKAGQWIKSKVGAFTHLSTKSSMNDLVTEVDKGSEAMIRNLIRTHFPEHAILGEEGVAPGAEAALQALEQMKDKEYLWIIDPVDGTTNFVHGFPFYSVSIAMAYKGEVVIGVVYDPVRDEMFIAEKGKGAYVGGSRMRVSGDMEIGSSLLATGFPPAPEGTVNPNMKGILALHNQARSLRAAGSAALHMAYVAAGRLSGFWEIGLKSWDIAAGALLIAESGGRVTDTTGRPYRLDVVNVLATNGHIHDAMLSELDKAEGTG